MERDGDGQGFEFDPSTDCPKPPRPQRARTQIHKVLGRGSTAQGRWLPTTLMSYGKCGGKEVTALKGSVAST